MCVLTYPLYLLCIKVLQNVQHNIMASGGDIYSATGFKCTEQDIADFMEMVYSYWNKHQYPALRKQTTWKIQLLKPSQWFKHHSILVQSAETGEYFTIELVVSVGTGVIPFSRHFDPSTERHAHLEATDLGEVQSSAVNLFDTALRCLKEFGQYDKYTNNCQDYCQVAR